MWEKVFIDKKIKTEILYNEILDKVLSVFLGGW